MSTTEQGAFEMALVTPASLDTIKAGLSKVDVRQVHRDAIYPVSSSSEHAMPEHSRHAGP